MLWSNSLSKDKDWYKEISNADQKEQVALSLVKRLKEGDVVGVGSGTTSYLTLLALASRHEKEGINFSVIPTSIEMELKCAALGLPISSLKIKRPDWSFDGADEVDPKGNMIKGRGGAMLREKLVMKASKKVFIVVDQSKYVNSLGKKFPVPVEVIPESINLVETSIRELPSVKGLKLRSSEGKDGPVITESGNLILDVWFSNIAPGLEDKLKTIVGVVETGLFMNFKINLVELDK